jgi:hypothetical protein
MTDDEAAALVVLYLRMRPGLKERVQEYARRHALSDGAAGIVLIEDGLEKAEREDRRHAE